MWLCGEFWVISSWVRLKVLHASSKKVRIQSKKVSADMCLVTVTAGNQVLIIFHPGEIGSKGPINTHTPVSRWVCDAGLYCLPVKVTTTCSGSSVSLRLEHQCRRGIVWHPQQFGHTRQITLIRLMSRAILYCCIVWRFLSSLRLPFVPSSFFFSPKCSGVNNVCVEKEREREAYKLETETCLFTMLWVNICLVKKKREKKQ